MKIQIVSIGVTVAFLSLLSGCKWWGESAVKQEKQPDIHVVNVLSKELYDDAHIKGSEHVEFSELEKHVAGWNKDVPVVVYCSNYACGASSMAARMLSKLGFKKVMAYEGGMAEWHQLHAQDASYEIEGPAQQEYLKVVVQKPAAVHADVEVVTAQQLKELMHPAQESCANPMGCCPAKTS